MSSASKNHREHGKGGVYYGGDWLDIEDCSGKFSVEEAFCSGCEHAGACPRSASRNLDSSPKIYDVVIVGAGCIGAAIARELSKLQLSILWLEAADDVSQGATKGNSGIVHAGYDDKPNTNRAKYCFPGNQMFAQLDKELRFGYQQNGSLVVAFTSVEMKHLQELKERGETNGIPSEYLRIIDQAELRELEPFIAPDAIGALHCPVAGNVIPYEFAIALAENAVDNGVELRIRREVEALAFADDTWNVTVRHWEPQPYVESLRHRRQQKINGVILLVVSLVLVMLLPSPTTYVMTVLNIIGGIVLISGYPGPSITALVEQAGRAIGVGSDAKVTIGSMLVGGSGSRETIKGTTVATEVVQSKYIINCAGGASDQIARMIGDESFRIKPRIGDYILLNRNQGHLTKRTLFPCPDPKLGKGVLVQATLWSNLILGPTARDMHNEESSGMSPTDIQEYILSKCKKLVPSFDAKETIHSFCGARAKSTRGDWIIEPSVVNPRMIHVAGIDSPGLAGSPAIAVEVTRLLGEGGLETKPNPNFNPQRAPIITPKRGMKGLKFGPVGKNDTDGKDEAAMAANVICKCERVTELEVVRALRRSLPLDSTQAIRKRTRAGMGHCQGDPDNYNCEARVKAIIARETSVPMEQVGGRPWPATSILTQRWIDDDEKQALHDRMMSSS